MKNKQNNLKIFRSVAVDQLRADLRSSKSFKSYYEEQFPVKQKDLLIANIALQEKLPTLKVPKGDPASADLENAIALHEYFKIDETQASDPRFWVYLSHVLFRKYTLSRWGIKESYDDLKDDLTKLRAAINQVLEHWFGTGGDLKGLRRHSLARLWWAAHLTYAPWEKDPEFFGDMKKDDPYYFTKILLYTQDIYQTLLERGMGRSSKILISILDYLDRNKEFADNRENIRRLAKELNLVYGVKKIIALDRQSLKDLIQKIATDINAEPSSRTSGQDQQ